MEMNSLVQPLNRIFPENDKHITALGINIPKLKVLATSSCVMCRTRYLFYIFRFFFIPLTSVSKWNLADS